MVAILFRMLEDGTLLRIVLQKQQRTAGNTWRSLLEDMYKVDAQVFDDMEKKMTLERFQREVHVLSVPYPAGPLHTHQLCCRILALTLAAPI